MSMLHTIGLAGEDDSVHLIISRWIYVTVIIGTSLGFDVIIVALPFPILYKLQLNLQHKVSQPDPAPTSPSDLSSESPPSPSHPFFHLFHR